MANNSTSEKQDVTTQELENYKIMWDSMCDVVKFYMSNLGELCMVMTRNYKPMYGILLKANFELKDVEILIDEKIHSYEDKMTTVEKRIMKIPVGSIMNFDVVKDKTDIPDKE